MHQLPFHLLFSKKSRSAGPARPVARRAKFKDDYSLTYHFCPVLPVIIQLWLRALIIERSMKGMRGRESRRHSEKIRTDYEMNKLSTVNTRRPSYCKFDPFDVRILSAKNIQTPGGGGEEFPPSSHLRFFFSFRSVSSSDFVPKSSQPKLSSRFFGRLKFFVQFEYLGQSFFHKLRLVSFQDTWMERCTF